MSPFLLVPFLSSPAVAEDPCPLPIDLVAQAEQAVVEGRFDDMSPLVVRFEEGLACAPPVEPTVLAAFLRAEGAWFHLTGLPDEARLAFRSAAALAPGAWTAAFGAELQQAFTAAADTPSPGRGRVDLEPPPADPSLVVHIDGQPTALPATVDAGLHAIQVVRPPDAPIAPGTARFGRLVAVFPDEDVRVNPGVLPVETAPPAPIAARARPTWLLGTAGGALLLSGVTAAVALAQPGRAEDAETLADVNQAERRQRGMALTSYGALGAGVLAGGLYFVW